VVHSATHIRLTDRNGHRTRLIASVPQGTPQSCSSDTSLWEQLALQDWQECISHSEDIVSIFQHWHPSYFALVDPMISSIVWFTCCLLSVQIMYSSSEGSVHAAENSRLESALDLLTVSLQRFSEHWSIAKLLFGKLFLPSLQTEAAFG
jgi:hypothetical protein